MTYSDSNPERRNLTILSLAIIIFYLAEGKLVGSNLNFTLVNIQFENKGMLIIIVWSMLFWFLFRYVVTNRHTHGNELDKSGVFVNMDFAPVRQYLKKLQQDRYLPNLTHAKVFCRNPTDWYMGYPQAHTPLKGLDGYLIIKLYLVKTLFKHRATTDYYTPYLLFLFAAALGIHNHLFNLSPVWPVLIVALVLVMIEMLYYTRD